MKVQSGRLTTPDRTLLYGTEGVGKTTFGAQADHAIVIAAEPSTDDVIVDRAVNDDGSKISTYEEAKKAVEWLTVNDHPYRTLVIDTADWVHAWIEQYLCRRASVDSIEEVSGGYGKGATAAAEEWRRFIAALERLQIAKGMDVLMLAHAAIKKYSPPDGEAYDRYEIKMPEKSAAVLREWVKNIYLAQVEVSVAKGKGESRKRAFSDGARVLRTQESGAYKAKNRYGLPETIAFDDTTYGVIQAARKALVAYDAELTSLLSGHPDPTRVRRWFETQPNKAEAIAAIRKKKEEAKS